MIKIAVSGCLLGNNVRYDGGNKYTDLNKYFDPKVFDLISICPEVEMGMSIPRLPIQIIHGNPIKLVQVDNHQLDFTNQMETWFNQNLERLNQYAGFILKSKSPSCGHQTTPHFQPNNTFQISDGLFVTLLKKHNPDLQIIDEMQLKNQITLSNFLKNTRNS